MKFLILSLLIVFTNTTLAEENDPFEKINRIIFTANSIIDKNIFEPIAKSYNEDTTQIVKEGVNNFFANLKNIPTFVNQILQLKLIQAVETLVRFTFNSTLGLAGIIDVATKVGLEKYNKDFGQTLGFYNIGNGPYLVLPILGSSSLRDISNLVVDSNFQINLNNNSKGNISKNLFQTLNYRANLIPVINLIYNSTDPYIVARSLYFQNREYLVNDGEESIENIDF